MHPDRIELLRKLGETVRTQRKARGWTRRMLASHTGVSERFLADIETAKANPSLLKLCDIAEALGTTAVGLLGSYTSPDEDGTVVALLGLRGAGKSAVGRRLATVFGWPLVELDVEIERATGMELPQIFQIYDQEWFRRAEHDALRAILFERPRPFVLATGGGIVTDQESWRLLRGHARTVWLRAKPEDHWSRVISQGDTRPMEGDQRAFTALCEILRERQRLYEQAEITVDTSGRSIEEIVDELVEVYRPSESVTA